MKHLVNVCWMYHDIMDLYGDKGNIMVLKKRCLDRNIEFHLDTCGIGEQKDLSQYDLIFLGGGADKEQISLIPDLLSRKENIKKAMDEHTFVLLICGGYQLFGQYYIAADGSKIEGLKFYDYYTDTGKEGKRCIGNIILEADLDGLKTKIIGFENHGGQTENVKSPLGKVLKGYGNSFDAGYEGFYDGKILGTYLHGPLLPKNPQVADFVITKAIQKRNPDFSFNDLQPLEDLFEEKARKALLDRFQIK
ncbi:glutamine amidotransferase [uncultured Faecalicoccus sp.]|uniref:type 1 glutamine amidotransferase n=1 Tax=uncultured Faecalicoccus sp. TaxID=1971760 RepID=UPI0026176061|nr:glutamine amidotransferase [uncultured Faecalicoccus sp.]